MSDNKPLRRGVDGVCTRSTCDWLTVTPESAAAENLSYWTDDDGE